MNTTTLNAPATPIPTVPPRPLTEGESAQFELSSYVLISRSHACASCTQIQTYSDINEVWTHPTKTALSNAKILKAARTIKPGYPIASVATPVVSIPICHECIDGADFFPEQTHESGREFPPLSMTEWASTIQRKALQAQDERREAAKASRPAPSLDML